MIARQLKPKDRCPVCGAARKPDLTTCWLCSAVLPQSGTGKVENEKTDVPGDGLCPESPAGPFQYGLSSLFLIMTLVAILCSIVATSPGLGIAAAILATPALIWTIVAAARRGNRGEPMSAGGKAGTFILVLLSVAGGIVVVVGAFLAAMFATCLVANKKTYDSDFAAMFYTSLILGGIAALVAGSAYGWLFWQRLRGKTRR
jgi:hypothetical protein